jgi:hypothetical protein
MDTIVTPVADRAHLAFAALALRQERKMAEGYNITDSDVLDVIDDHTTGTCPEDVACTSDECCDYQRLAGLVWGMVEAAIAAAAEEA